MIPNDDDHYGGSISNRLSLELSWCNHHIVSDWLRLGTRSCAPKLMRGATFKMEVKKQLLDFNG